MASVFTCEPENITITNGVVSCSDWVITEYTDSANLITTLDNILGFDPVVFAAVELLLITTFFAAFGAGKIARILGKA